MELTEASGFTGVFAFAETVRVFAVTLLELGKILGGEGAVLLCDAGDVGTGVENPNIFGGGAFLKKDDVGFNPLTVRGKCSTREAENRVEIAILHENFEDFAGFPLKQTIVRQDHGGAATGL